jgi:hypothetical protein
MIQSAHIILYSEDAGADRAFLRDVLELRSADAGDGWLIFALPPAEVAVHPSETGGKHQLYLMCEDVEEFIDAMRAKGVACSEVRDQGWGLITAIELPSGTELGVYQPRHASPLDGVGVG